MEFQDQYKHPLWQKKRLNVIPALDKNRNIRAEMLDEIIKKERNFSKKKVENV